MLDPSHARGDIKAILNKREYKVYHHDTRSFLGIWWEKALKWITENLANWFPALEPTKGVSVTVLIALIVVVISLLLITTFLIFRSVRRSRILRENKPVQSIKEINWSFQQHLLEARKQEVIGMYPLATRHLFLALLLYFHEKGWLEARIWKTNWEYYDELRKRNQLAANQFYNLASFFDEVTYGERKVEEGEYLQFQSSVMDWMNETEMLVERGQMKL